MVAPYPQPLRKPMAITQIEKLKVLREVKRVATSRKDSLTQGVDHLTKLFPDLKTQIDNLFAATFTELAATITRVSNALASITVTDTDRINYAKADETDYRNNP